MPAARFLSLAIAATLLVQPALAQSAAEAAKLAACIAKIETDPDGAYEDGLAWSSEGNRPAARHCTALALVALGHEAEGAARLETLANATDAGGLESRAVYLAQAGNAWLLARAPDAAIVALTNALKLRPSDADLYLDRARAQMMLKMWEEAGKDLDAAIRISPGNGDAHHLRSRALLQMERYTDAWDDIVAAMRFAPDEISILVTRGEIREGMRLKGLPDPAGLVD